mmetsp:Transcript_14807/g.26769  ORF Transcript_14807/g.26769 Transcript_14807/m.26769 type:complete len:115 (-) Transcript_14807:720-1064(-)
MTLAATTTFAFVEEGSKHLQRCHELSKIEATPFLRAGFQQATNTIVGENTHQCFANPGRIPASSDDKDISIVDRSFLEHVVDTDSRMLINLVSSQLQVSKEYNRVGREHFSDSC